MTSFTAYLKVRITPTLVLNMVQRGGARHTDEIVGIRYYSTLSLVYSQDFQTISTRHQYSQQVMSPASESLTGALDAINQERDDNAYAGGRRHQSPISTLDRDRSRQTPSENGPPPVSFDEEGSFRWTSATWTGR